MVKKELDKIAYDDTEVRNQISSLQSEMGNTGKEITQIKAGIEQVNSQIDEKANEKDLQVQKARIDNLATLTEGSTTGDAELKDIRTGADGTVYTNAGESVRGQINKINNELNKYVETDKLFDIPEHKDDIELVNNIEWSIGSISASTGIFTTNPSGNAYYVCSDYIDIKESLKIKNLGNLYYRYFWYDKDTLKYVSGVSLKSLSEEDLNGNYKYRIVIIKNTTYSTTQESLEDANTLKSNIEKYISIISRETIPSRNGYISKKFICNGSSYKRLFS